MDRKLLFIVNPIAGKKKAAEHLSEIISVFCAHSCVPTVLMTAYSGHATKIAEKYAAQHDLVVCAGGDGTLNEVISGLRNAGLDMPVGYLPCGTTNDLGSTLELSRLPAKAAEDAVTGEEILLDIGELNGRHFVYTASFGAFTKTSYETPQSVKNVLGHFAYLLNGVMELGQLKPTWVHMDTDDGTFEGEYLFGSVTNATSLGGVITIERDMIGLDDGKFELLLADMPYTAVDFSKLLLNVTQRKFGDMLHLHKVSRISKETREETDWTLDGEQEKGKTHFEIKNLRRAARIVVPRKAV